MTQLPLPLSTYLPGHETPGRLGLPTGGAQPELQMDCYKELINKIAWAIGSAYRLPYNNQTTLSRQAATTLARDLVNRHGYPNHIAVR